MQKDKEVMEDSKKKQLNINSVYINNFFMKDVFRNMTLNEAEEKLDFHLREI